MKKLNFIAILILMSFTLSCKKDKFEQFSVVYEVEYVSTWSTSSHPSDFPSNAHMSPFVAVAHIYNAYVFYDGLNASDGLKDLAETGNTEQINNEFQKWINQSIAIDKIEGNNFSSPGQSEKVLLGMKEGYPAVTCISMIAPSPDWFVATRTLLQDPNDGLWYNEVISHVAAYDAGTDSGASFTSNDSITNPVEPVHFISADPLTEGLDSVVNMGYFKFTKVK